MAVGHDYYQKAPMKMNISHGGVCICMLGVLLSCDLEAYVRPLAHASYLFRAGGVNSDSMALERHTKTIRRQWDWFSYSSIPGEKESALLLTIFIASSSHLRVRLGNIFFLAQSLSPDLDSTGKKNYRVRVEGKPRVGKIHSFRSKEPVTIMIVAVGPTSATVTVPNKIISFKTKLKSGARA
ncbi:cytochrome c biogenesis CcmF C-terminal-like mitochondrial protein [Fagus crenata]